MVSHNKGMKINQKRGKKKVAFNEWKSTIQEVYENENDKECGIPPLFCYQLKITNVDVSRVKIDGVSLNYTRLD